MSGRPAVFLDRDGTLNVEVEYLGDPARLELIPGALEAVRRINDAGLAAVLITNQAGIARGYYDQAAMEAVHARLAAELAAVGAHLDGIYFCPHHPQFTGACDCRKPEPGMLLRAAADLGLDLARSWLIGDNLGDIGAGQRVGCKTALVRTGYGRTLAASWPLDAPPPDLIADDVGAAVARILAVHE